MECLLEQRRKIVQDLFASGRKSEVCCRSRLVATFSMVSSRDTPSLHASRAPMKRAMVRDPTRAGRTSRPSWSKPLASAGSGNRGSPPPSRAMFRGWGPGSEVFRVSCCFRVLTCPHRSSRFHVGGGSKAWLQLLSLGSLHCCLSVEVQATDLHRVGHQDIEC